MNRPTLAASAPALADLSLNWTIRLASPNPVRQPSTQASSACSGTWLCTKTLRPVRVKPGGEQLRGGDPGPAAQLRPGPAAP